LLITIAAPWAGKRTLCTSWTLPGRRFGYVDLPRQAEQSRGGRKTRARAEEQHLSWIRDSSSAASGSSLPQHQHHATEEAMRKIIESTLVSADGVVGSPPLWAMDYLMLQARERFRCLIVAPLTILETTWAAAIFRNFLGRRTYEILTGSPERRLKRLESDVDVYIVNHDGIKVGAHIRRINPRGQPVTGQGQPGGSNTTHRLIRRGLPYGPAYDPTQPYDGIERGLLGYFINSSIENQYEFVLRQWVNDSAFAGAVRLHPQSKDPLIGTQDPTASIFVMPQADGAPPIKITGFSSFITTKAAAYCFLPSITAVKFISKLG